MQQVVHKHSKKKHSNDIQKLNKTISEELIRASEEPVSHLLKRQHTSEKGLTNKEAKRRLKKYGFNEIAHEKKVTWFSMLLKNFANPFNLLLIVLSIFSYFLGDHEATLIILVLVALSVMMRFFQEFRSHKAAEKLRSMVSAMATVYRLEHPHTEPVEKEIPIKLLVPGDIVHLSAGDMVPGDLRLLSSKDLYVTQSALTGEAIPVEKFESLEKANNNSTATHEKKKEKCLTDIPDLCFLGTEVVNGSAKGVILKTGNQSYFGSMAKSMTGYRAITSFDKGVNQVSWFLIQVMCILIPLVFIINGLTKGNVIESLLFALTVAVGFTPEMLPMIVTANLAKGAIRMSKKKVIVKHLSAIQNFGALNILCTDKTGTLTQNKIILERYLSLEGKENSEVLLYAYLNSYYQTGLKNLLDLAVLDHKELEKKMDLKKDYRKVDEIPFDFERRRMSVIVEKTSKTHLMVCKGAVEEVLSVCSKACLNSHLVPLNEESIQKARKLRDDLNNDGLRVLAVAYKEIPDKKRTEYHQNDEKDLILLGFLAFLDPPKQSVKDAITDLKKDGVEIKVITGDSMLVTKRICKWVGIDADNILTGNEVDQLDNGQLYASLIKTNIFAKVSPLQKARIISVLRSHGNTVGYLGDGINDALALREADIGISVDTAVDVAKEAADIILLEKSLTVLGDGVIEGRKTFGNIIKYIKMAASSNFGNVFSILGASILLPFLPMKPIQLLVQNFLYDISQIAIPFDRVDEDFLRKPRMWDPKGIARFMLFIGPISSIFDYLTFGVLWFVFKANAPEHQALFQTGWFVEGLLSQTLIVHMIRTKKIPFFQSWPSMPLLLNTLFIMAVGILIPYSFIGHKLGMVPLPLDYFPWLIGILLSYCTLIQVVKFWYIKRFHSWL